MKRTVLSLLTVAALALTACTAAPADSLGASSAAEATPTPAVTEVPAEAPASAEEAATPAADASDPYAGYVESLDEVGTVVHPVETEDNRSLTLECTLYNEVDQLIYDSYRDELLGDLNAALALAGDVENYRITVENAVRNVQEGAGMQSYTLHEMHLLTAQEVQNAEERYRDAVLQDVANCGLTQWAVQEVDLSWTYTEAEKAKGPQLDEGRYQRYFLVGKSADGDSWLIYDVFFENFLPES